MSRKKEDKNIDDDIDDTRKKDIYITEEEEEYYDEEEEIQEEEDDDNIISDKICNMFEVMKEYIDNNSLLIGENLSREKLYDFCFELQTSLHIGN
jgi:GMP synthase PP-ATPase subunit